MRLSASRSAGLDIALFVYVLSPGAHARGATDVQPPLALRNVTVIDGTGTPPRPGRVVVVAGGTIEGIHDAETWEAPEGTEVLDLDGHYLIPGLINGHVHLSAHRGDPAVLLRDLLHRGVTAVRDLGGDARTLAVLARDARLGSIAAPDVYYAANFFGPEFADDPRVRFSSLGHAPGDAPWAQAVTAETDLALAVAAARGTGATGLKLYASLDPALLQRITAEAHRQGLKVWAHATVFPSVPSEVVEAGVDGLEHVSLLRVEGASGPIPATWSAGFNEWLPSQPVADADAPSVPLTRLYSEMASRGVHLGTTLHVAHLLAQREGIEPGWSPTTGARQKEWDCRATRAAHEAGVSLVAGTDLDGSVPIQEEMALLVSCGLSPLDAITAGTSAAAQAIGIERSHGSVEAGKAADLVPLGSDPTEDVRNATDVVWVMKAGRRYEAPVAN